MSVGRRPPRPRVDDGRCPDCGAGQEKRKSVLGGTRICMGCGHEEKGDKGDGREIKSGQRINVPRR